MAQVFILSQIRQIVGFEFSYLTSVMKKCYLLIVGWLPMGWSNPLPDKLLIGERDSCAKWGVCGYLGVASAQSLTYQTTTSHFTQDFLFLTGVHL